jgi:hypothetical protein
VCGYVKFGYWGWIGCLMHVKRGGDLMLNFFLDVCKDGLTWYGTRIEVKASSEKNLDDFPFT